MRRSRHTQATLVLVLFTLGLFLLALVHLDGAVASPGPADTDEITCITALPAASGGLRGAGESAGMPSPPCETPGHDHLPLTSHSETTCAFCATHGQAPLAQIKTLSPDGTSASVMPPEDCPFLAGPFDTVSEARAPPARFA
jgi:hypothetical protein